jgi:hypothetical protein
MSGVPSQAGAQAMSAEWATYQLTERVTIGGYAAKSFDGNGFCLTNGHVALVGRGAK